MQVVLKTQKLNKMNLTLQIQKRKNYLALFSIIDWGSDFILKTCARKRA